MLLQEGSFYCKAPKKYTCIFLVDKKKFSVLNRAHLDTLKVFFGKMIYYYFSTAMKNVFCVNSFFFGNTLILSKKYYLFCKEL